MVYIDWYHERTTGEEKPFETGNGIFRDWEDLITGTHYCIAEEDYQQICEDGKSKLRELKEENKLDEMEKLFYHSGGKSNIELFADLPYFMGQTKKCVRIRDYICFRTGCLYILKYGTIQNSRDPEREKKKLRMEGFTWGFVDHSNYISELEQIDLLLLGENKDVGTDLLNLKADFIKGGTVKIKQYYLETNKIPEIRGASLLLDQVNSEGMVEIIKQIHIRECLVYAGGGKIMAIVPEGTGANVSLKLERLVEKETVTAQSNFYSHPYKLVSLVQNYKKIIDEMDLALEERQGLRWDFRIEPNLEKQIADDTLENVGYKKLIDTDTVICTSCRSRLAVTVYEKSEEKLCPSCLCKRLEGGRNAKYSMHQRFCRQIKEKYKTAILEEPNEYSYNKLEDIAENNFIGIIYGDANSMGKQINQIDSFMKMRYFSEIASDTVTDIVYDALYRHLKGKLSFEVIAVGGDDIFLIVPGTHAYDIACTIGRQFDERFQNKSDKHKTMTMSIGVCITHANMPVQYSFKIAQELLKSAKQEAWKEQQKGNVTGTIDYMVIENEMAGSADLDYQRESVPGKPQKTLRPYTWTQAGAVKKFLHEIQNEKSLAFQLRQSWYQHIKEEAELFYEYQISRKKGTNLCHALERFAKSLGGRSEKCNIICNGDIYSPWLDLVEIWDYVEGME